MKVRKISTTIVIIGGLISTAMASGNLDKVPYLQNPTVTEFSLLSPTSNPSNPPGFVGTVLVPLKKFA